MQGDWGGGTIISSLGWACNNNETRSSLHVSAEWTQTNKKLQMHINFLAKKNAKNVISLVEILYIWKYTEMTLAKGVGEGER